MRLGELKRILSQCISRTAPVVATAALLALLVSCSAGRESKAPAPVVNPDKQTSSLPAKTQKGDLEGTAHSDSKPPSHLDWKSTEADPTRPSGAVVGSTSFGGGVPAVALSQSQKAVADQIAQERATAQSNPSISTLPRVSVETMSAVDADEEGATEAPHPDTIEAFPNIEAPDTVYVGQEIAVQVSLSDQPIDMKTRIVSGKSENGKVQIEMGGKDQIPLIVNVTAPGLEFSRGSNTQQIALTRDGNSTVAAFYMRPQLGPDGELGDLRNTRILATLLHDQAFIARISRPITLADKPAATRSTASASGILPSSSARAKSSQRGTETEASPPISGLNAVAPTITIIENRVGKMLRLVFILPYQMPVTKDIADADALHQWINSKLDLMAHHGRGFAKVQPSSTDNQSATDLLNAFGSELCDRVAPPEFIEELFHHPMNEISIQVLSDDPSIPWELMRPIDPLYGKRTDSLGTLVPVARWPLMQSRAQAPNARPPQTMHMVESVVVAPQYAGSLNLAAASSEREMLAHTPTFVPIDGTYTAVRYLASYPPRGFIHFAGHGAVRVKGGVPQYAILLNDGEIAPDTWTSLRGDSAAPGTVYFFNACEVGETTQFMNDVDGWAPALLSNGASGYIGALWDISDVTANRFAAVFYKSLIDSFRQTKSVRLARVLTETRRQVFEETKDPTALAYVFYGDPALSIER
jgi:CHAT domain-containing protein